MNRLRRSQNKKLADESDHDSNGTYGQSVEVLLRSSTYRVLLVTQSGGRANVVVDIQAGLSAS